MLAIVRPDDVEAVQKICERWGLPATPVAKLRGGGQLFVQHEGGTVARVPARALSDEGPVYERRRSRPSWPERLRGRDPAHTPFAMPLEEAFLTVLGSPSIASMRWVYEQYDSLVQGGTVIGPGSDAAVLRLEGSVKAVAVSTDGNGRYGYLDPYLGGAHAVAEAARNVASVGARPLAVTNCLNFGNPERPEVMWAFSEAVRGMGDACRAFGTPVTGGNVSFYNESGDSAVYPTPVVGVVGLLEDYRLLVRHGFPSRDLSIYLLGSTLPELGGSEFADVVLGQISGVPPALDFEAETRLHGLLTDGARDDLFASAHDLSDGGLAIALAESAIAGDVGFSVVAPELSGHEPHVALFSESASRAVVTVRPGGEAKLERAAAARHVPIQRIGVTGGSKLHFASLFDVSLSDALVVYEGSIPRLMGGQGSAWMAPPSTGTSAPVT
jgi:phosphoribosylformylglycinamidine synthase subunit PurL